MFHNMKYVYQVYQSRSFSKAAAKLYISQPALSAAIKKTETKVGGAIFERSTNKIQLTECGKHYIKAVEKMMDAETEFLIAADKIQQLETGRLVLGGSNLFVSLVLPPMIEAFNRRYPEVKIHLVESSTRVLEEQLLCGELDMVLDNLNFDEHLFEKITYGKEELILAVPTVWCQDHPLALTAGDIKEGALQKESTQGVNLAEFQDHPFLFLRAHNDTRWRAEKICGAFGFTPKVRLKLDQQISSYHIANAAMGIAFVTDTLVTRLPESDGLRYFKIDHPKALRDIHFHYKSSRYATRAMTAFLELALTPPNHG
ncbi:MAG: LysR family transcriptional regulator [Eubacteriales bacterium]